MRAPATLGHLLPVAVPGLVLVGALGLLVTATPVGAMVFSGPWTLVVLSILAGVLVAGYAVAGLAEAVAARRPRWALPPETHLAGPERAVTLPARAVQRAGFATAREQVRVPVHLAYALERSLAGAWGVPEDHWSRTRFLQRLTVALVASVALATAFLVGDALAGHGITRGMREHAGTVILAGGLTGWLAAGAAERTRRHAVVDLLADARAMVMDRGEHREVRRVLDAIGLELADEEAAVGVQP